ncbi:hypothetical protein MMC21_008390 [Puttea exsequens]|nr:hypothetical protein [Puttea exsequens]
MPPPSSTGGMTGVQITQMLKDQFAREVVFPSDVCASRLPPDNSLLPEKTVEEEEEGGETIDNNASTK